jgi:predicted phage terminase large subunit-like protein
MGEVAPDCEFILTSATSMLSTANAMAVRRIIQSEWYQELYPHVKIDPSERDVQNYFKTTSKGTVYGVGLGGQITGFAAGKTRTGFGGAIIIDDPLKAVEARSRNMLEKCNGYYTATLKSRRNNAKETPIIIIQQRLHIDDLIGFVMSKEPDDWHLVQFPAYDEQTGTVLNEMTMDVKELMTLKEVDPPTYFAQYQQTPILDGGNIIKSKWWKVYEAGSYPSGGLMFLTIDSAFKTDKHNDESVVQCWACNREGLYLVDGVSGRWGFPDLLRNVKEFWDIYHAQGCSEIWTEDAASGTPLTQTMEQAGIPCYPWLPSKYHFPVDKVARVRASSFSVQGGKVHVPSGNCKVQTDPGIFINVSLPAKLLIEQASIFTADMSHLHDDHVDAFTMAVCQWQDAGGIVNHKER